MENKERSCGNNNGNRVICKIVGMETMETEKIVVFPVLFPV